jgi:hypothetical protein
MPYRKFTPLDELDDGIELAFKDAHYSLAYTQLSP